MRLTPKQIVEITTAAARQAIVEAKKKAKGKRKKKSEGGEYEKVESVDVPPGYKHVDQLDYARPQGRRSIVKAAGAANFGPLTGEQLLRKIVSDVIREQLGRGKIPARR